MFVRSRGRRRVRRGCGTSAHAFADHPYEIAVCDVFSPVVFGDDVAEVGVQACDRGDDAGRVHGH